MTLGAGLLLALVSAAAINLGFLLQHRGLKGLDGAARGPLAAVRVGLQSRAWIGGQTLGWVGFVLQIVAVSLAPLSLVQAFAAGGLALSVPLGAGLFGHRIGPGQRWAVLLAAAGLASLPLGLSSVSEHVHGTGLMIGMCAAALIALTATFAHAPAMRAIAAGLFYGIADAGIKVITLRWHLHGASSLLSGWTAVALLGTVAGFLAFQAALRHGNPVSAISLMNSLAALVALACGVAALGETLGHDALIVLLHAGSILLILSCLPLLAAAHTEIARELIPAARPAEERAAQGQNQGFEPRTHSRGPAPKYVGEVEVARQGE